MFRQPTGQHHQQWLRVLAHRREASLDRCRAGNPCPLERHLGDPPQRPGACQRTVGGVAPGAGGRCQSRSGPPSTGQAFGSTLLAPAVFPGSNRCPRPSTGHFCLGLTRCSSAIEVTVGPFGGCPWRATCLPSPNADASSPFRVYCTLARVAAPHANPLRCEPRAIFLLETHTPLFRIAPARQGRSAALIMTARGCFPAHPAHP